MKTSPKSIFDNRYKLLIRQIVAIRQDKGLTQRQLAAKAKVSHCFIGRTETKERRLDLIETIDLLKVLGLTKKQIIEIISKIV